MGPRLEPGTPLGVFEVLEPLGAGGMGEVYRARDTRLGRDVALKTLPAALAGQPARLARLRQEGRILAALNHPHVATLFGLEETNGTAILVMELVEGSTLADRLRLNPPSVREALELARQIAAGLEAAHEKGVLHRDLKPANIVIDQKGRAKLLDFGLATTPDEDTEDSHVTTASAVPGGPRVAGTAPYLSPEQARGEVLDKRTDIWSFGCVIYEMLSGRRAFTGASWAETTAAILERDPDWAALPEATPPGVLRLLGRCLQKDRERRLRDMGRNLAEAEARPLLSTECRQPCPLA
jgi:serine/threonine protein kinase